MEIENVYYRLWGQKTFTLARQIYRVSQRWQLPFIINFEQFVNIRDNNSAFLKELEKHRMDGIESVSGWLEDLWFDYTRRSCDGKITLIEPSNPDYHYFTDWLDNTRFICSDPFVQKWCIEHEELIKFHIDNEKRLGYDSQEVQAFKDKIGYLLGKEETEHLLRIMPKMKPKEVKAYYQAHPKLQTRFELKEFFELLDSVVHRGNEKGWNYDNIKR